MYRIFICVLMLFLLSTVCACAPAQQQSPEEPAPPVIEEVTPVEEVISPTPDQGLELPLPVLELRLTDEPVRYKPTPSIVPLTNARRIYTTCLIGEVTFIRAADQSRVELPPDTANYQAVRAEVDGAVIAYALIGGESQNHRMAFMSVDGNMLTDFIYDSFGEDYIHFPNRYGYVTVLRDGAGYGLFDLATSKEIIAAEYDELYPLKYAVLALKDGQHQLLSYNTGWVLLDCGDSPPESIFDDDYNYRWPEENLEYLPHADKYRRIRFEPEYSQQLEDAQGNLIIPLGVYGYINVYEPFLIGSSVENSDPDFDILNMQGELLLHNPLGAITYEGGLSDAMVVWLDEGNCVFLYQDGSMEPILDPPKVERVYFGG